MAGSCSSVDTVLSNDDLLIEILLRLPAVSLLLFKSVSKHWLSLITSPAFPFLRCSQNPKIDHPSGFYVQHPFNPAIYDFVGLDNRISPSRTRFETAFKFGSNTSVKIVHSCNGLLLCKTLGSDDYYIYNPSSNRFKILPPRHSWDFEISHIFCHMKLAFDPTKSPHYKVVYAPSIDDDDHDDVPIHIYSSETSVWSFRSVSSDQFLPVDFSGFKKGIYWNDAIHWIDHEYIYKQPYLYKKRPTHYKLNIVNEHPVLTNIQFPVITGDNEEAGWDCKLFESCGCLLLLFRDDFDSRQFNIYEMRNGYYEWSFMCFVDLDDIRINPDTTRWICDCVWFIILGDKEEDTCMVFENDEMVLLYKIVSKTTHELCEMQLCSSDESFLFTASFAGV